MTTFADGISVIESVAEVEECDQKADVSTELLISKTSEISLLNDNEVRPKTWCVKLHECKFINILVDAFVDRSLMRPNFLHEIESFSRSLDTVKLIIYMNKDQNESRFLVGITCDSILIAFATANNAAWRNVKPGELVEFKCKKVTIHSEKIYFESATVVKKESNMFTIRHDHYLPKIVPARNWAVHFKATHIVDGTWYGSICGRRATFIYKIEQEALCSVKEGYMIHAAPVEICEVDEGEPIIQCSVTSEFAVVNVYNARLDIIN